MLVYPNSLFVVKIARTRDGDKFATTPEKPKPSKALLWYNKGRISKESRCPEWIVRPRKT